MNTITCRYHGWTYDLSNGLCVAALTDGPDSPIVGKARVKTYPLEERKGIIWAFIGDGQPLPWRMMCLKKSCIMTRSWASA